MNIGKILSGDYIGIVKEYLEKLFQHEAKKFQGEPHDLWLIIYRDKDGKIEIGTGSNIQNKVIRMIPDKEAQEILMK